MKKNTLTLLLFAISTPLFLSSCGTKTAEVAPTDDSVVVETVVDEEETPTPAVDEEEKIDEGMAVGEQSNLAPSDTPRGIAEGGLYLPYTPTALAQASGNIILFFYASWSPTGISTNKDITDKKATLPKDLTILRVNFDDADEMKEQYGVTEQQTFVQVSNTGELIKKWRGANTLEDIVQQIQK